MTEEEAVKEFDAVSEAAVQLRIYSVTLAIDDFGSGYSSFARLKQFPFSEIKLDRSYVQNCATDPVNASICQSIVDLARATGAICVAEGIETETDWNALIRLGCNLGQGYLFGRPMSVGKLIERTAGQPDPHDAAEKDGRAAQAAACPRLACAADLDQRGVYWIDAVLRKLRNSASVSSGLRKNFTAPLRPVESRPIECSVPASKVWPVIMMTGMCLVESVLFSRHSR